MELTHVYRLTGLDRDLYASVPHWPEGHYRTLDPDEGELTLVARGLTTPEALTVAHTQLAERARKFCLALSLRTGCPLVLKFHHAATPEGLQFGVLKVHSTLLLTDIVDTTIAPVAPPTEFPQLPLDSARWIYTLTETQRFGSFPDEILKRLYLLIEELWPRFSAQASDEQHRVGHEARLLRDFVSHPRCDRPRVVDFITAHVPSAVVAGERAVQFDRTDITQRNFIGRFEPCASSLARWLVDRAIEALDSEAVG